MVYLAIVFRHELSLDLAEPDFDILDIAVELLLVVCLLQFGTYSTKRGLETTLADEQNASNTSLTWCERQSLQQPR